MANNNFVCTLSPEQIEQLRTRLENGNWEFSKVPYSIFKASGNHTAIVAYESGKLVVQGRGTEEFVLYTLEPEILHTFNYQSSEAAASEPVIVTPHGGIDESGKGDFFGPLVIAGVCVNEESGNALADIITGKVNP